MHKEPVWLWMTVWLLCVGSGSLEARPAAPPADLTAMSLDELMNITITSVSKKEQKLSESAAAIFVITPEDIRRSGATTIAEALRLAPGVHVAHLNANTWGITIRGFNGQFANKLLVLIDGRTVYTPLNAGVFWDVQDLPLEDIERIEVIRGPGASLWGANAVNGVINIITKRAQDTQGGLVVSGVGNQEHNVSLTQYGGKLHETAAYRAYVKYFNRGNFRQASGVQADDAWHALRGGGRIDWDASAQDKLFVDGAMYDGESQNTSTNTVQLTAPRQQTANDDADVGGGHVLTHWDHAFSDRSTLTLQGYYDRTVRLDMFFRSLIDTADMDFQHRLQWGERHETTWGLGYRVVHFKTKSSRLGFGIDPQQRTNQLLSAFIQHDLALVPDRLHLIVGSKFEHNDYSGFELQPTGRLAWTPTLHQTLWAAVSRAVRTPSPVNHDSRITLSAIPGAGGTTTLLLLLGSDDAMAEDVVAYEFGYRTQPTERASIDVTTFFNRYHHLSTVEPAASFTETDPAPTHLVRSSRFDNNAQGESYGVELASQWRMLDWWKVAVSYSFFDLQLSRTLASASTSVRADERNAPHHLLSARSAWNLPRHLEWDVMTYYVDATEQANRYVRLDTRLGWRPIPALECSLVVQNLLDDRHPEIGATSALQATEVPRAIYGQVTWRF